MPDAPAQAMYRRPEVQAYPYFRRSVTQHQLVGHAQAELRRPARSGDREHHRVADRANTKVAVTVSLMWSS